MANTPSVSARKAIRQRASVRGGSKRVRVTAKAHADRFENDFVIIRESLKAFADGDFSVRIPEVEEPLFNEIAYWLNIIFSRNDIITREFSRISREVAEEGKLTAYAPLENLTGSWRHDLECVNNIVKELAKPIKEVSRVMRAVAAGDLTQKITIDATGEIRDLKDTINTMVDQLNSFAAEVTRVAKEVGTEGKLGGQADVKGVSGTWRDLTESVNQLAGNLTTQVRAIADVVTAVARGDLTPSISVEAQGEVLELKDNINQMIKNLRDTTTAAKEQDWLKTNLARFSSMMQGQRSILALAKLIMNELTPVLSAQYGVFYVVEGEGANAQLRLISSYAYTVRKGISNVFRIGEGLVGQAALEKKMIVVTDVPEDYIHIVSGLGEAPPKCIVVLPILFEGQLKAVIELASFQYFSNIHLSFLEQLAQSIGVVFNMISASMRTEELLLELQKSNAELEGRSQELERRSRELEMKNYEIAKASAALEEKARELSQISKYKSDFLANMSHELRTPLNSLLILAKMLADNETGNLTPRQVEFAKTIYSAGNDLLSLINEILDLSKIEAGKVTVDFQEVPLAKLIEGLDKNFRQIALEKKLEFKIYVEPDVPRTIITDGQRLNQVLRNLLANAFKFTEKGSVRLRVYMAEPNRVYKSGELKAAKQVIAFEVADTGVGIPQEKQESIFEAFQQADTTISKKYGGTGLGLTISQNLVKLLGGELGLKSEVGIGSVFTLYLPLRDAEALNGAKNGETVAKDRSVGEEEKPVAPVIKESSGVKGEDKKLLAGRRVLVVDDDARSRYAMSKLFESRDMLVGTADSGESCIEYLKTHRDCDLVLLDVVLPGEDGFAIAEKIKSDANLPHIPVITFSSKSIPFGRERAIASGCADYIEDISDSEVVLRSVRRVFETEVKVAEPPSEFEEATEKKLEGRKILVIDDDPRNLFAMASFLEAQGAEVVAAAHADEGISNLKKDTGIEVVLMDIMLPEIDGYEATRMIRKLDEFKNIPIIAVTAKAMAEDRKRAEEAGCTDFVPKPVVNERLLNTILKHLPRQAAPAKQETSFMKERNQE